MLQEIDDLARRRADFGFETTLAGLSHLKLIRDLEKVGYQSHIYYLWLPRVELALDRVRIRVLRGGHSVPEPVIRRRFDRSIRNFLTKYRILATSWILFDNSGETPRIMASETAGKLSIIEADKFRDLVEGYVEI
jgi:predicted ABC-type ATPase